MDIEDQYLKDAFYKHMSQNNEGYKTSQYAKMSLVYVIICSSGKTLYDTKYGSFPENLLNQFCNRKYLKKWYSNPSRRDGTPQCLALRYQVIAKNDNLV